MHIQRCRYNQGICYITRLLVFDATSETIGFELGNLWAIHFRRTNFRRIYFRGLQSIMRTYRVFCKKPHDFKGKCTNYQCKTREN